jgi:hypothetical protein
VGLAIDGLREVFPAEQVDRLAVLVDDKTVPAAAAADVLGRRGYPVMAQTVLRHRKRHQGPAAGCKCPVGVGA